MASLLSTLARKERERFFWRLDAEWGKGFKRGIQTHPDRSRDPRVVSRPPQMTQYAVDYKADRSANWETLWQTEFPELATAYAETLKADGYRARVSSREPISLSANQSALIADLVTAFRAGCENQTLVKRAWEVKKAKVYRSTRLLGIKPAPIDLSDSLVPSPDRPIVKQLVAEAKPQQAKPAPKKPIGIQMGLFGPDEPVWAGE